MQNQEKKDKPHRSEFAAEFLDQLYFTDPQGIIEAKDFFKSAYIELSNSESFDHQNFRIEWLNNLNYLNDLCLVLDKYSKKQIDSSLDFTKGLLVNSKNHGNE